MRAGEGSIVFDVVARKTAIASLRARAPLKLLAPRNHGVARWAVVSTYGGGLVDGDVIALDVKVKRGARALVGTQASTKVYRSPRGHARQTFVADVDDDALLVVAPDPLVPFAGARYEQRSTIRLAPRASLAWIDVVSCGRAARGERWAFARYAARTRIVVGDRDGLVVDDALVLDAEQEPARTMGRFDALATVFVVGPALDATRDALFARHAQSGLEARADVVFAASPVLGGAGACLRVLGARASAVTAFVQAALSDLRATLGDDPFAHRW